jgi:glucose-6-phosphate isomerase
MMHRTVGMYIANRIKDEILKPPAEAEEERYAEEAYEDPLDGEAITNEDGAVLGVAQRLQGVALYVVGARDANANTELERAMNDPEAEVIVHREGRTITALVYVPSATAQVPSSGTTGFRADEV